MTDGKGKMLVAYHEVGHAVCATLQAGHDPVQKVTLIPRGQVGECIAAGCPVLTCSILSAYIKRMLLPNA